jgi:hypothetical protein
MLLSVHNKNSYHCAAQRYRRGCTLGIMPFRAESSLFSYPYATKWDRVQPFFLLCCDKDLENAIYDQPPALRQPSLGMELVLTTNKCKTA